MTRLIALQLAHLFARESLTTSDVDDVARLFGESEAWRRIGEAPDDYDQIIGDMPLTDDELPPSKKAA